VAHRQNKHTRIRKRGHTTHTCAFTQKGTREHSAPQHVANAALSVPTPTLPVHLSLALHLRSAGRTTPPRNTHSSATISQTPRAHTYAHTQSPQGTSGHTVGHHQHTQMHSQAGAHYAHMRLHAKGHARALGAPTRCKRCPFSSHPQPTRPSFLGPALTFCRSYNIAPQHTQRHGQPNAAGPHTRKGTPDTSGHTSPTHTRIRRGDLSFPPALP
jgi:hypothetical protein